MTFKFDIGQIVRPVLTPKVKAMVLERRYIQVGGEGLVIVYKCSLALLRHGVWKPSLENVSFYEIELTEWEEDAKGILKDAMP